MSTYTNPVHLVRAMFYTAAAGVAAAGALGAFAGSELHPAGLAALAAVALFFAGYAVYGWRRATAARDALLPAMLSPGGAPGAQVLAQWRVGGDDWRELARMQPPIEQPPVYLLSGVLAVAVAALFSFPSVRSPGHLATVGGALAAATVIHLLFRRRLRFDARTAGDGSEIVIARDAVVLAGRFHWLRDPNERLAAAEVVEHGGQAYLQLQVASVERFGASMIPIWIPVPPPRVDEARRIAAELAATVPPRLARAVAAAR
jgi:hypothetical protein